MTAALVRANALALPLRSGSVDVIVTSPPYFGLRSYQDDGEDLAGQIGAEPTSRDFLDALWAVTLECGRVLKPSGSMFINLGDKYAESGGHNNTGITGGPSKLKSAKGREYVDNLHTQARATRRNAPDRYNQESGKARRKSLLCLPWRYAIGCVDQLGLILRSEIIWSKPNGMPESVGDRVRRSHEQWFHLTKEPVYFANMDEIREPYAPGTAERLAAGFNPSKRAATGNHNNGPMRSVAEAGGEVFDTNPLGKLPGSVWTIPSEPLAVPDWLGVDHFAAFPQEWPRRLILGWCPPGGVVLDPFGGTGTTAMVARALGRTGISVDLSADYLRLARWRIFQSGHAAKSVARTNRERQGEMF